MSEYNALKERRILLVEDDPLVREAMMMAFHPKVASMVAVETAENALEVLRRQPFDVIVSDYKLPGMNGIEFLKVTKVSHPDIGRIIITAYGDGTLAMEAAREGIHDYIMKPFSPRILLDAILRWISTTDKNHKELGSIESMSSESVG